jgi:uncharacterized protein (DUF3084 family)
MSIFKRETKQVVQLGGQAERLEGEIREFVRRDQAAVRRHSENPDMVGADNIRSLLQRVSGKSIQEIDEVITRLEMLRDRLQQESARVQRELAEYANLSQAALQSTKVIAETLSHWRTMPDAPTAGEGS